MISTYPPQRCGIGYYTRDMLETLLAQHLELEFYVFAEKRTWIPYRAKDKGGIHEYRVWDRHSYLYPLILFRSIQKIKPDLVLVQHEYGLYGYFGGYLLSFLLALLKLFRYPIFMTMHTVCPRRRLIKSLKESLRYSRMMIVLRWIDVILTNFSVVKLVEKVIVHSEGLASQMIKDYSFPKEKIVMIPHGASNFIGMNGEKAKELLDLKDKFVILSLGFLSYRKGYEYAIKAISEPLSGLPGSNTVSSFPNSSGSLESKSDN